MAAMFILVGGGIVGLGVWFWVRSRRFLARAVRTSGVIVGLNPEMGSGGAHHGGPVYRPVFRFTAPDGRDIVARAGSASNHPTLRPGDGVPVLFDPERPSDARIDSIGNRGPMTGLLTILFGIAFAGIGVWILTGTAH